jgi:GNAT superfamily N-acetyltransferase
MSHPRHDAAQPGGKSSPEPASTPHSEIQIREFQPGDEAAFRELNEEWIIRYFRVEAKDESVLADPQETILASGGKIFFAIEDHRQVGCCALVRMGGCEFEISKMAVTAASQGAGIGRRLLQTAIAAGRAAGARRLYLETNHVLKPAIRLYESLGFKHLPPHRVPASLYARADVFMEMILS